MLHFRSGMDPVLVLQINRSFNFSRKRLLNLLPCIFLALLFTMYAKSTASAVLLTNTVPTAIISTVSRGIGLEFARQLLNSRDRPHQVIGYCRSSSKELLDLQKIFPDRLRLIHLDLEDKQSILEAAKRVSELTDRVDLLINSAGILGDGATVPGPERSIETIDIDWFEKSLQVNLIGHVMVTKSLLPFLKRSKTSTRHAIVVNLSARVGSIEDNRLGGWYSYRMSKAALNMFTKTSSIELKRHRCVVISMHPGTTATDLSAPFQRNVKSEKLFSVDYSVACMLNVILGATEKDTGKFFAYDGTEIPF